MKDLKPKARYCNLLTVSIQRRCLNPPFIVLLSSFPPFFILCSNIFFDWWDNRSPGSIHVAARMWNESSSPTFSKTCSPSLSLSISQSLSLGTELSGMCPITHDVLLVGLYDVGCDLFGSESDPSCALSPIRKHCGVVDASYTLAHGVRIYPAWAMERGRPRAHMKACFSSMWPCTPTYSGSLEWTESTLHYLRRLLLSASNNKLATWC